MDPKSVFTRRAFMLGAAQGILGTSLLGRLYWLQIESREHFQTLSDKNRIHGEVILPLRGQILDENGHVLAGNQFIHSALLVPAEAEDWKASLYEVAEILELESSDIDIIIQNVKKKNRFTQHIIKAPLSWEELARLELNLMNLEGVRVEQGQQRFYPLPQEFCHVLGYVGKPTEKDTKESATPELLHHPGYRIGKSGIEKIYEQRIIGLPGMKQVEVNATRQVVRELETYAPTHGADLHTTLNLDLQKAIYERVKEFESASIVVMDVKNGGLKAAVSTPGFDMNQFTNGIPKKIWGELSSNPYHPLLCKFVQGQYAPGSPFKMITALAGLASGKINHETKFFCPGHYDLGNHRFHCWRYEHGHGHMNVRQAIAQSCDTFFYELALKIGVDAIAEMAQLFGMGHVTELNFPHEKAGLIPTKSWKEKVQRRKWTASESILTSIGQGYVLATPLQLCLMTARLAAKGKMLHPSFNVQGAPSFANMDLRPEDIEIVYQGMCDVMSDPTGTAYGSRSQLPGIDFAGKTGTAQVRRLSHKDRETKAFLSWPWHWRDHALFVGFAPTEDARYAISVVIEHGGSGGKVAAPVGRDILTLAMQFLK